MAVGRHVVVSVGDADGHPVVVSDVPVLRVGLDVALSILGGVHSDLGNVLLNHPAVLEDDLQGRDGKIKMEPDISYFIGTYIYHVQLQKCVAI